MNRTFTFFYLCSACLFAACNANSGNQGGGPLNSLAPQPTYEQKVMSVEETERADPVRFLDASLTYRENFWGGKFVIDVTVGNNATVANYKDVVVELVFFSETETELSRKQLTLYEYFPAHSRKNFNWKIQRPANSEKLGIRVVSATPY